MRPEIIDKAGEISEETWKNIESTADKLSCLYWSGTAKVETYDHNRFLIEALTNRIDAITKRLEKIEKGEREMIIERFRETVEEVGAVCPICETPLKYNYALHTQGSRGGLAIQIDPIDVSCLEKLIGDKE